MAAQTIDSVFFRWQVRAAQLRRRTTWPLPDDIYRLRTRSWRAPWMGYAGPANLSLLDVEGVRRFEFASSEPVAQRHDQLARGRFYEPQGTPRGAVVLVPGALTGAPWNGAERLYPRVAEAFTSLGLVAARIELPLHESRAPAREISGHEMLQGDLFTYVRAVAQAVRDLRSLAGWLRNEYGSVGLWGLSIGALIAALAAERDARFSWAVLAQPAIRAGSAWGSPITAPMREHMRGIGVTREDVELVLRGLEPVGPPAIGASRVLLQGGRWDRLATAEGLAELGRRWPGAEVRLYDAGHISLAIGNRWLQDGSEFVTRLPRTVGAPLRRGQNSAAASRLPKKSGNPPIPSSPRTRESTRRSGRVVTPRTKIGAAWCKGAFFSTLRESSERVGSPLPPQSGGR